MIRHHTFVKYLTSTATLDGDIIEIGVHQGRSLQFIGRIAASLGIKKPIYGVDTFTGMPDIVIDGLDNGRDAQGNSGIGGHKPGDFGDTSIERVKRMMEGLNVTLIQGIFPECASQIKSDKFCFAHVDVDIYKSYKDTYNYLWPRMVPGGVIICGDDYDRPWLQGAKLAIDEASEAFGVTPIITLEKIHIMVKP